MFGGGGGYNNNNNNNMKKGAKTIITVVCISQMAAEQIIKWKLSAKGGRLSIYKHASHNMLITVIIMIMIRRRTVIMWY